LRARTASSTAHEALDGRGELKEAQGVGDGGPALPDPLRQLLVGQTEIVDQLLESRGLFKRVKVLAVQVLHESLFEAGQIIGFPDDGRDGVESGPFGRPPPPFTRDQLVAVVPEAANEDRLEDTELDDGRRQRGQALLVEVTSGLVRVGCDRRDRDLEERGRPPPARLARYERPEAFTQPAAARHH
jgi:hypothetical protein